MCECLSLNVQLKLRVMKFVMNCINSTNTTCTTWRLLIDPPPISVVLLMFQFNCPTLLSNVAVNGLGNNGVHPCRSPFLFWVYCTPAEP